MMEMTKEDILKDLLMTPSPSGCEQAIIKKMAMFLKDYIDELSIDNYGNLIALNLEFPFFIAVSAMECNLAKSSAPLSVRKQPLTFCFILIFLTPRSLALFS